MDTKEIQAQIDVVNAAIELEKIQQPKRLAVLQKQLADLPAQQAKRMDEMSTRLKELQAELAKA